MWRVIFYFLFLKGNENQSRFEELLRSEKCQGDYPLQFCHFVGLFFTPNILVVDRYFFMMDLKNRFEYI